MREGGREGGRRGRGGGGTGEGFEVDQRRAVVTTQDVDIRTLARLLIRLKNRIVMLLPLHSPSVTRRGFTSHNSTNRHIYVNGKNRRRRRRDPGGSRLVGYCVLGTIVGLLGLCFYFATRPANTVIGKVKTVNTDIYKTDVSQHSTKIIDAIHATVGHDSKSHEKSIKPKTKKMQKAAGAQPRASASHDMITLQTMLSAPPPLPRPSSPPGVTLITHATPDRLYLLEPLCARYPGPITLVVYGKIPIDLVKCDQLSIMALETRDGDYPVNELRNIGLLNLRTTHYIMADIDFLPSNGLYSAMMSALPGEKKAVVIPAFSKIGEPCSSPSDCEKFVKENEEFVPVDFEALEKCLGDRECEIFQNSVSPESHGTTNTDKWLQDGNEPYSIPCFDSSRYEPYLLLPRPNPLPLYDESFHGYGKNKISMIAHLRHMGYTFEVIRKHFLCHFPHEKSSSKTKWENNVDNLHKDMDKLFGRFQKELKKEYGETPIVRLCDFI